MDTVIALSNYAGRRVLRAKVVVAREVELRGVGLFRGRFGFGGFRRVLGQICRGDRFRGFRAWVFLRLCIADGRPVGPLAGGGLA